MPTKAVSNVVSTYAICFFLIATTSSFDTFSDSENSELSGPPSWTESLGSLIVPSTRLEQGEQLSFKQSCSASLITKNGSPAAKYILTAWHCLENYSDISRPIIFKIKDRDGKVISRIAYRLSNGGGMHADWAILKLDEGIKQSRVKPIEHLVLDASIGASVFIAGFTEYKNSFKGHHYLSFSRCKVTEIFRNVRLTDCKALKGNSGGPVMLQVEHDNYGLVGVISEGNETNISSFVPIEIFYNEVQKLIE